MAPRAWLTTSLVGLLWLQGVVSFAQSGPSPLALELRNLGYAQLENEREAEAEATFRRLTQVAPDDPLGFANLAVALLRLDKGQEALDLIDVALQKAPGRADLLGIRADALAWLGRLEEALPVYRAAGRAAPNDPELQFALLRHCELVDGAEADEAAQEALSELRRLRPENVVVLLQAGKAALQAEDREAASGIFLRLRNLTWQIESREDAERALEQLLGALEANDLEAARRPARVFENVFKFTPLFQSGLKEINTGIRGIPVARFIGEPPPTTFGQPVPVRFRIRSRVAGANAGRALAVRPGVDGASRADVLRVVTNESQGAQLQSWPVPELNASSETLRYAATGVEQLLLVDVDNDGTLDLLGSGASRLHLWRGLEGGGFEEAGEQFGTADLEVTAVEALDYDLEGDLDLAVALSDGSLGFLRNSLNGPLVSVSDNVMPQLLPRDVHQLLASDLDRDGDQDLLVLGQSQLTWLDNKRQGSFRNRTAIGGLRDAPGGEAVATADLDNDGYPELLVAGDGLALYDNLEGVFRASSSHLPGDPGRLSAVLAFDADNDGRLDLAAAGERGLFIWLQRGGSFESSAIEGLDEGSLTAALSLDLEGDGDLDLIADGPNGLLSIENVGGNANHWLNVRLRGLDTGSDKNNVFGRGATLELKSGSAYQYREVREPITHFGLGKERQADILRAVWNNGVPQNRLQPGLDQLIVEEQVLKGSCPFLYTWDGDKVTFVTDLLWGAPIGMPVAPGVWASFDPDELVRVDRAALREDGVWDLRITEELWEAAFFDRVRLWVVDHPEAVELASNLRVIPGQRFDDEILAASNLRPVTAAWDGEAREVTDRVLARDGVYADGYPIGDYQGVAAQPWTFTFDLGEAPGTAVRLWLEGWVFPADASLNLAVAQRHDLEWTFTRLEVETARGFEVLLDPMGFPAGKTKPLVVDTPPLPRGARRLRIVTSRWLHWDRIAWQSLEDASAAAFEIKARLEPTTADLRFRGFSRMSRSAPNAPHHFDYSQTSTESPWLPFPGHYTRYGDVRELLLETDDRFVVLASGDEIGLTFDARSLPPPAAGHRRTVFLESFGYDKDADRNTYAADSVEPLPFRAMSQYPFAGHDEPPAGEEQESFERQWLSREVAANPPSGR